MFNAMAIGALAASLMVPMAATDATTSAPPKDKITIGLNTVNGSGCPNGTTAVAMNADNTAFTVTYSDYLAQTGVGSSATDFRKNCQLSLRINVPQGFTYAIAKADYRGFALLEKGANAMQRANYYFMGESATTYATHSFKGPFVDDWMTSDQTDYADLAYAPCGEQRNLNINTELRVYGGSSDTTKTTSFITMDSTDASASTTYHFSWKQCS
jgi:hypothetical protein